MATVLITGGTGMIGSALSKSLLHKGYSIIVLTRKAKPSADNRISYREWNIENGTIDQDAINRADFVIHLAGANVADGRWTDKRKKEIIDSRVKSGELLAKSLREIPNKVKCVVAASAIGWYGADKHIANPRPFVETDKADESFLGTTCQLWEQSVKPIEAAGARLVILRTGIVLSKEGGAYAEFIKPLKFGVATILGDGRQMVSWIHIDDVVRLYMMALENSTLTGIYNAVAPFPVSNKRLILDMAAQRGKFNIPFHVPGFALKTALGEMSVEVLKSATVSSRKVEEAGFTFLYPSISDAIKNLTA